MTVGAGFPRANGAAIDLAAAQDWTTLDRRGNWGQFDYTIGATPQSVSETRTPNAVNEYEQVDPDGPNGSGAPGWPAGAVDAKTLQNDLAGNLYTDLTAACPGDPAGGPPSGQAYLYDEESRLREVQKYTTGDPLLTIEYDALGRRVRSTDSTTELTTYHVYGQGLEVIEEWTCAAGSQNCTPTLAREFVYGRDSLEPVTMIDWTAAGQKPAGVAEILHYLQDALGSIVALTNPAAHRGRMLTPSAKACHTPLPGRPGAGGGALHLRPVRPHAD